LSEGDIAIECANMANELAAFVTIAMAGRSAAACHGTGEKTLAAVPEVPLIAEMLMSAWP
jgi:hypothetical protein